MAARADRDGHEGPRAFFRELIDSLLEYAAGQFRRSRKEGSATLGDHAAYLKAQGIDPVEDEPELPPMEVAHLWGWFCELHAGRQAGFGPGPITWEAMSAWAALTRRTPAPWEVDAIRQLDAAWLTAAQEQAG